MSDVVRLETDPDKKVATIRLDRPPMNAIDESVTTGLSEVCDELAGRDDIAAVVVWGGPKIFAAGADINEFPSLDRAGALALSRRITGAMTKLEQLPQVTIAAVNGFALGGGCELALAAELRVIGEKTAFGQPEILLGLVPGAGGTQRLTRVVGVTRAKEIIYSGRQVKADEALAIGLATAQHADDDVYEQALAMATQFATGPRALRLAKRAIMDGLALPLDEAVAVESEAFADCFETDDVRIGVQSFLEHGPGKATFGYS